ncbi:MAG: SNF2-related protein [Cyanophyceae cyanobacterium]
MKFRDYQKEIIDKGVDVLGEHGFVYLAMEVRTGKTLTSLGIAKEMGAKRVLFITKKKAISSIESDYKMLKPGFTLDVINYESVHKIEGSFDLVVLDEAHSMGAFPKPSKRAKQVKIIILKNDPLVILLSGTPTPESYSQMYHQIYAIPRNPFRRFINFYRFCDEHVNVTQRPINGIYIKDYSKGLPSIMDSMQPYFISYSQKEAGFQVKTNEHILHVKMSPLTYNLAKKLQKNLVVEGKNEVILADTPVKLMMKLHQIYSGTVKFESGASKTLDYTKAQFIKDKFKDKKIGIFYKFKEEFKALKEIFQDNLTTDLKEFVNSKKSIALQIISGREGISLRQADCLVYYNIDFSATSYWQSRDRMTTKDRIKNEVYWIFSEGGIEDQIYKAVVNKKDYTLNHFKKDLLNL